MSTSRPGLLEATFIIGLGCDTGKEDAGHGDSPSPGEDDLTYAERLDIDLSSSRAKLLGVRESDYAGDSVAGGGDVDGDGFDDVLVGATTVDTEGATGGAVYRVSGGVIGTVSLADADARIDGGTQGDFFGTRVVRVGDFLGDGRSFAAAGAPGADLDGLGTTGVVRLLDLTSASGPATELSEAVLEGERHAGLTGAALAALGDTEGDGYADLAVAAPQDDALGEDGGLVYVVRGPVLGAHSLSEADATFVPDAPFERVGAALAGAGDMNGDGVLDLAVGVPYYDHLGTNEGAACVFYGPFSGSSRVSDADGAWVGETDNGNSGNALASVGDVDGDGLDDLAIGAPADGTEGHQAGAAYIVLGPSAGTSPLAEAAGRYYGEVAGDLAGNALAGSDLDGDGRSDLAVGAYTALDGRGSVYVLLGPPLGGTRSLSDADILLVPEAGPQNAGNALAAAGDVDADGLGDLLIAARSDSEGGTRAGAVFVVAGVSLPAAE